MSANLRYSLEQFLNTKDGKAQIEKSVRKKEKNFILNIDEVYNYNPAIAEEIIERGSSGITVLEQTVDSILVGQYSFMREPEIHAGIIGDKIPNPMIHEISARYVGKIIKVSGLVARTAAKIRPVYSKAVFKCSICGDYTTPIEQEDPFFLMKPLGKCSGCDCKPMWLTVDEDSILLDSQEFQVQEDYDFIDTSRIPAQIKCITYKRFLMNLVNCGDEVEVIGIVKLQRKSKTTFTTPYLDVINIKKYNKDIAAVSISKEDETLIKEMASDPKIYDKLIDSFAPSICGSREEKEGILLSIFGAPDEKKKDITIRGTIHILLVGDPSTAKSQLLKAAVELSPKGKYAVGRGSTAAGLTAALHQNQDTKEWEIAAGTLVLANGGIAAIDEIDKMRDDDRINIHEAMEQQTVTINKAGVHACLPAQTAVIAAANPPLGRFDPEKSIFENIGKFPPSLFSRFDLIFKMLDLPDPDMDMRVVSHIVDYIEEEESYISTDLFRKYISYAKKLSPKISKDGKNELKNYFVQVRQNYNPAQKSIPFTYRQFEAMKRLTMAHARMLLKEQADGDDIEAIKKLFNRFLLDIGHDIEGMECGKGEKVRKEEKILNIVKKYDDEQGISKDDLIGEAMHEGIEASEANKIITKLQNENRIVMPDTYHFKTKFPHRLDEY